MNDVSLSNLDLNLLTALEALLTHASVSQAAASVGRTQSAMSHSLARLRDHFGDPILVLDGRIMRLTPRAERLQPLVLEAAAAMRAVFAQEDRFDPAASQRKIKIAAPDLCAPLLSGWIGAVARKAPSAAVEFVDVASVRQAVVTSQADVGLAFGHPKPDANLEIVPLTPLAWCSFAPAAHPFAKHPSGSTWAGAAHVIVGTTGADEGPVARASRAQGLHRDVRCHAPNFSAALVLAASSNALFTTLREPFAGLAEQLGLVACPPPFEIDPAPLSLILRKSYGDRFHLWLRQLSLEALSVT
ncbi:LysR family transcriptional regulator [Primorskyibacter sp. S187A]|uniref:LysR family transcriptional regulator n=1 Tax=Primorskyibacter sp. S187A TaxID=3415130 RepID=UPI003C7DF081